MIPDRSRHISGIFNYCDRWCERCPYTSRCGNYEFGKELEEEMKSGEPDASRQLFWKHLDDMFPLARMMERESFVDDQEEDTPLPAPEAEGFGDDLDDELNEQAARNHECAASAYQYMDLVTAWFEAAQVIYEEKTGTPSLPGVQPSPPSTPGEVSVQDALEVVLWFQRFIWIKLMRALTGKFEAVSVSDDEMYDVNGSAKIALIGMDRSLAAWGVLVKAVPALKPRGIRMIVLLSRLIRRTEETFPDARAFVRPGFDTGGENPPDEKG